MPHVRMRSIKESDAAILSDSMVKDLAAIIQTSEDNFTFELVATKFFNKGTEVTSYPFIEVLWFERPQAIQDQCAKFITDKVKDLTRENDVVVVFLTLDKKSYYENGQHF